MDLASLFAYVELKYKIKPYPSFQERKEALLALKQGLQENAYLLSDALNKDYKHRSEEETLFLEILPTIKAINYCLKHLNQWMKNRKRSVTWMFAPARAYLFPQPVGVVGIMVPWNYPIFLSLIPAAYAVAAGNRVMIKMSEFTENMGMALDYFIKFIGLQDYITIVNGDASIAKQFSSLPFGHLLFTGSTKVGKQVMKAASEHLTPVTLELGGKSPAILSTTMNHKYFSRLFMGKLFNSGQTCIAPDYLLVPEGWEELITAEFKQFIHVHYPDLMNNNQYSSIISASHKQRLLALVEDANNKGAQVVAFGDLNPENNKVPVFLLFQVTPDMQVMQEELFGPILPVITYQSIDEAVDLINSLPNPLALYYFGEDRFEKQFVQNRTLSGALTINDTVSHVVIDDLPFGGVGMSGIGQYHGPEGFNTFSKLKPVFIQRRFSSMTWFYPPYGKLLKLALSWIGGIKLRNNSK